MPGDGKITTAPPSLPGPGERGGVHPGEPDGPSTEAADRSGRFRWSLGANYPLLTGLLILGGFVVIAVLSLAVWYPHNIAYLPDHVSHSNVCPPLTPPTIQQVPLAPGAYPLGITGGLGFNVLKGLVMATPWDLAFLSVIVAPAVLIGSLVGTLAGGSGGWVDDVLMVLSDVFLSVPEFVIALLAALVLLNHLPEAERLWVFALVLNLVLWAPYARVVRARARLGATLPFVEAAKAAGAPSRRIFSVHILPSSIYPVFAQVPSTLATVLLLLGGLQYASLVGDTLLCTGELPTILFPILPSVNFPEWTWILANGAYGWVPSSTVNPWWGAIFPALWILLFGLGVTLTCDGLNQFFSREQRR
jgi:peptide/nickel transport system permease protein